MKPKYALIGLYSDENKLLLQNRKSISKRNEEWGFFGGSIEIGETDLQAIIRETKEELDIDLNEEDLIFLGIIKSPVSNIYSSIFISKLNIKLDKINVLEGDGCDLFNEEECLKLKLHAGDKYRTKLVFNYLKEIK